MLPPSQLSPLAASFFWIAASFISPFAHSEEAFVALGSVGSNGSLVSSASRAGAAVVSSRLGVGSYEVSIVQLGAFQNGNVDDYVVEAGVRSSASSDIGITATIASITDDTLVIQFHTADLENSATPDDPVAVDQAFYFAVRNSPYSATIEGDSRYLIAAGTVSDSRSVSNSLGVGGAAVRALRESNGNTELYIENPGAFQGDNSNDYAIFLTSLSSGTEDEVLRANVKSTVLDSSVAFTIHCDDVQANPVGSVGVPADGDFAFAIYRIHDAEKTGVPFSRVVAISASVAGNDGSKINGSTYLTGATVITNRIATGTYTVTLISPRGTIWPVAPLVTVRGDLSDRTASAQATVINGNLQITVWVKDVQSSSQSEGVLVDSDFDLVVYSTGPGYRMDLAVSNRNVPSTFKYFGTNTALQMTTLALRGTNWGRFYLGYENTGRYLDGLRLETSFVYFVESQFFRITGGRTNVTSEVRLGKPSASDVRPGEKIYFEGAVRYRNSKRRFAARNTIRGNALLNPYRFYENVYVKTLPR